MESYYASACVVESHQIVDDELFPRFQKKRSPTPRAALQIFALLVAERRLYDPDAELRPLVLDLVSRIIEIFQESLGGLPALHVRNDRP